MKMIPMPEPGDKVILGAVEADDPEKSFPETEAVVDDWEKQDFLERPVYDCIEQNWQVVTNVRVEGVHVFANIKWDDDAKVWRD